MNTLWNGIRNEIKCDSLRATEIYGNIDSPTSNNLPISITGATGYFGYFYSNTGEIDTLISNTIFASTGEIGTLYSNTIYAATGIHTDTLYSNTIDSTIGEFDTLNVTNKIIAPTAEIDTLNVTNKIVAPTGEIGTLVSATGRIDTLNVTDKIVAPTGEIDTLNVTNKIVAPTGEIGTLNVSNKIVAPTGEIGTLNANIIVASTGIYSASSFTRDQSTGITVPNISDMYQYYATGPTDINITNNNTRLNPLLGSSIIGSAIPASVFSVGSVFELYFAGSFIPTLKKDTNFFVGVAYTRGTIVADNQLTWKMDDGGTPFPNQQTTDTTRIQISSTTIFSGPFTTKKLRIQSTDNLNKYQIYVINADPAIQGTPPYKFYDFWVKIDTFSGGSFIDNENLIAKFEEDSGPGINVNLTFTQSGDISNNFFCQTILHNTNYYTQPHSFSAKSVFHVNANPGGSTDTISIVSSNSGGIILIRADNFNVNSPFNTYEKSVIQNMVSFPKTTSGSADTVNPYIVFSIYAQSIKLTVNNYYLRRIA
jgi:hypothetical protein